MNILLLTNQNNEEKQEDLWIAEAFERDGHAIDIRWIDYEEELDDNYDVILKRNIWISQDIPLKELQEYERKVDCINKRLKNKNKRLVNFNGKFDEQGKDYLVELFHKYDEVVPSIDNLKEVDLLPKVEKYLLKPKIGYDGIGQRKIMREDLLKIQLEDFILQPFLEFESEVQFYFINHTLQYALEFKPSKIPVYPKAIWYQYSKEEAELAQKFADLNEELIGIQRIDFLKLKNGELKLIEIEDASPYLDLDCLDKENRSLFINHYKKMVYQYNNK